MRKLTLAQVEEIRAHLSKRAPEIAFTAAEAAIYTGRSTRTLKRAVDAGVGPRREKNPDVTGLGATNRHTRYRKADLDAWRESLVAFATGFRDFDDLAMDAPWVVGPTNRIAGHLTDLADVEAVLEAAAHDAVVFLRLDEALRRTWSDADARARYQSAFEAICEEALRRSRDQGQEQQLDKDTAPAIGQSRPPLRT